MSNDGLAILVVLGLGGLVLWYLTRPAVAPLVVKKDPPCAVSYQGYGATCAALEEGAKVLYKGAGLVSCALGFCSGRTATPEESATYRKNADVTGCGGWKGECMPPLNNETQVSQQPMIPVGKPAGYR